MMAVQPLLKKNCGSHFINFGSAHGTGEPAFKKSVLRFNGGQTFVLKENDQSGFFKLRAESAHLFRLKTFCSIHIQRKAGKNLCRFILITDRFNPAGIRPPANPGDHIYWRGDCAGGIRYSDADSYITDIQCNNSFIHTVSYGL